MLQETFGAPKSGPVEAAWTNCTGGYTQIVPWCRSSPRSCNGNCNFAARLILRESATCVALAGSVHAWGQTGWNLAAMCKIQDQCKNGCKLSKVSLLASLPDKPSVFSERNFGGSPFMKTRIALSLRAQAKPHPL